MNFRILMILGVGGFLGTIARYVAQLGVTRLLPAIFPYGTLFVNVAGCFVIGSLYALADRGSLLSQEWRVFLMAGFCGGFTTFSAFSLEALILIRNEHLLQFSLYVLLSVAFGLLATFAGMALVRAF